MEKLIRSLVIYLVIINVYACATMTIEGDGQKTPQSKNGTHTVHGTFYGFNWSEPPVDKCDNRRGLYRARYHTNAVYVTVPVVSLGLYVPQTVEWWCDGTKADDDDEEIYVPAGVDTLGRSN